MRIYFLLAILVAFFCVYFAGVRYGTVRGKRDSAVQYQENISEIIKIQEEVNAEVFSRATDDIRGVLRQKYTIAE